MNPARLDGIFIRLEEFAHEPHGFSEDGNRRMEAMLLYFVHECMKAGEEWEGRI